MRRFSITAIACLALAFAAGCGSDDESDSASSPPPPPAAVPTTPQNTTTTDTAASTGDPVEVTMKDIKFVPETITAKVDQKIEWTNGESVPHNVTATEPSGLFASDTLNEGDTFDYTPTKAGKIDYVCTIHSGQNGSITVTE